MTAAEQQQQESRLWSWNDPWAWANALMCLFFWYAARVQLNDPDWYLWFTGYALTAVQCFRQAVAAVSNHHQSAMARPQGVIAFSAALALLAQFTHHETIDFSPKTEVGREAGGLVVVLVWMSLSVVVVTSRGAKRKRCATATTASPTTTIVAAVAADWWFLALAALILASAYLIPTYLLQAKDVRVAGSTDHCVGLGFGPPQELQQPRGSEL